MKTFRDLIVWQKAMQFATEIYKVTSGFPITEQYGLTNQLRRAIVSVSSNIAEGSKRGTKRRTLLTFLEWHKDLAQKLKHR